MKLAVRATATHVLLESPDHVLFRDGQTLPNPVTLVLEPANARIVGEALIKQAEAVERHQGAHRVDLGIGAPVLTKLPPYPEQGDEQLKHLEAKRRRLLDANEEQLLTQWKTEKRKHQI